MISDTDCAGLLGEYVRQAGMARSTPVLHADPPQDTEGPTGRGTLGQDLDTGYVLPQRETRHVSRSYCQQSVTSTQRYRLPVVRHQVSSSHLLHVLFLFLLFKKFFPVILYICATDQAEQP